MPSELAAKTPSQQAWANCWPRVQGHRLAEIRRGRELTQQAIADRMGITKGRVSQIERGNVSGHDVLARYATALGGTLHQSIYFDDGDIAAIA